MKYGEKRKNGEKIKMEKNGEEKVTTAKFK